MEEFFRNIGLGAGILAGFLLICYGFADFTVSHCKPIRELYESEFKPEYDDVSKWGYCALMLVFGIGEVAFCALVISIMYLIGTAFR